MDIMGWRDLQGKWNNEPDILELDNRGYHMVVLRNPMMGNLNGYVGVNINHPSFGLHYDHKKMDHVMVHGGITYAGNGGYMPFAPFKRNYWYFGFDTAHAGDLVPQLTLINHSIPELGELMERFESLMKPTYRDLNYVSDQVNALTEQLQLIKQLEPDHKINHKKMYKKLHKIKKG